MPHTFAVSHIWTNNDLNTLYCPNGRGLVGRVYLPGPDLGSHAKKRGPRIHK